MTIIGDEATRSSFRSQQRRFTLVVIFLDGNMCGVGLEPE